MSCYSEFTYSVYADGELPSEEKLRVEAHLATCRPCRAVVEALRAETMMIVEVLADARMELETLPELQPASPSRLILGALAALAGVTCGVPCNCSSARSWSTVGPQT